MRPAIQTAAAFVDCILHFCQLAVAAARSDGSSSARPRTALARGLRRIGRGRSIDGPTLRPELIVVTSGALKQFARHYHAWPDPEPNARRREVRCQTMKRTTYKNAARLAPNGEGWRGIGEWVRRALINGDSPRMPHDDLYEKEFSPCDLAEKPLISKQPQFRCAFGN
jgi:hypothetical protein